MKLLCFQNARFHKLETHSSDTANLAPGPKVGTNLRSADIVWEVSKVDLQATVHRLLAWPGSRDCRFLAKAMG
jgi:hypothetical protein